MKWYFKLGSMGPALVIDEADGRTVAVAYDEKDAALLAAAPELLARLAEVTCCLNTWRALLEKRATAEPAKTIVYNMKLQIELNRSALRDTRVLPRSF